MKLLNDVFAATIALLGVLTFVYSLLPVIMNTWKYENTFGHVGGLGIALRLASGVVMFVTLVFISKKLSRRTPKK